MRLTITAIAFVAMLCLCSSGYAADVDTAVLRHADDSGESIQLQLRSRAPLLGEGEAEPDSLVDYDGTWRVDYRSVDWDPAKTAVIVCDMWDKHFCPAAMRRGAELAPRMNRVVETLREQGALVIHSPSGTMEHYADTPQRKLAQLAPKTAPIAPSRWYSLDPKREAPLPIDDSDNGSPHDDIEPYKAYSCQTDTIPIKPGDAITDSAEAYHLMHQRGIENVIIMGVHTNMCVLGRPFGIRNLVTAGKNVVLMRDMTDTMYDPKEEPKVSHVRGTELVVEHIEKFWCPTVTSSDILGGPSFRLKEDDRPHIAILVSDDHYGADVSLPIYADVLRSKYDCKVTIMHGEGTADIHGTDELKDADCLVVFIRRLALPKPQLDAVRDYIKSGRPVVGLRTASHAFDTKGVIPEGCDNWVGFDPEVLGGNYSNHAGNALESDIQICPEQRDHPVLAGVGPQEWHSPGSLYFTGPLKPDCTLLMTGTTSENPAEPITWLRSYGDSRVAYSALGHPDDFKMPQFQRLLANMLFWAMKRDLPAGE